LNCFRPKNIPLVLSSIRSQNISSTIFLWNNGKHESFDVDKQVNAERNYGCWPRWMMGLEANTEYICTLDDDLMLKDNKVISDAVREYESGILGPFGVNMTPKSYRKSRHLKMVDKKVDIVKGRLMLMRSDLLKSLNIENDLKFCDNHFIDDDIIISALAANRMRKQHKISSIFKDKLVELPQYDTDCMSRKNHFRNRNRTMNEYFGRKKTN